MMALCSFHYGVRVIRIPYTTDEIVLRVTTKSHQMTTDVRDGRTFKLSLEELNASVVCKRRNSTIRSSLLLRCGIVVVSVGKHFPHNYNNCWTYILISDIYVTFRSSFYIVFIVIFLYFYLF